MSNPYIEAIRSDAPHIIFTGRNALSQAIFYDNHGRMATPDDLYMKTFNIEDCSTWGVNKAKTENTVSGVHVKGSGVHAKMYILPSGSTILSSQNNCSSALFEFAVLYPEDKKVKSFIKKSIDRAVDFSEWWKKMKSWMK